MLSQQQEQFHEEKEDSNQPKITEEDQCFVFERDIDIDSRFSKDEATTDVRSFRLPYLLEVTKFLQLGHSFAILEQLHV